MHFPTGPAALSAAAILVRLISAAPAERAEHDIPARAIQFSTLATSLPPISVLPSILPPAVPPIAPTLSTAFPPQASPTPGTFEWAAIGDSWSSGVAYSSNTQYDGNAGGCFRTNEAWAAQMGADNTWTLNPQNFHFIACAGAKMADIKAKQIGSTGSPQLLLGTIGGNNAFFGTTVDNCIYQGLPFASYGNPYDQDPNGTGACKMSLSKTQSYVGNAVSGFGFDLKQTLNDVFASAQAKSHPNFYLYISSYANFFNSTSDTCDNWSFSPWWRLWKPKLVKPLRQEFNDQMDAFHNVYSTVIGSYTPPSGMHLGFIPISDGFQGHRFCEPNHSLQDQWSSSDVWIWNLQFSNSVTGLAEVGQFLTDNNGTSYMGQAPDDNENNYQNFTLFGSSSPGSSGWSARPFHPKILGHTSMKNTMIQRLKADNVPGIKV